MASTPSAPQLLTRPSGFSTESTTSANPTKPWLETKRMPFLSHAFTRYGQSVCLITTLEAQLTASKSVAADSRPSFSHTHRSYIATYSRRMACRSQYHRYPIDAIATPSCPPPHLPSAKTCAEPLRELSAVHLPPSRSGFEFRSQEYCPRSQKALRNFQQSRSEDVKGE